MSLVNVTKVYIDDEAILLKLDRLIDDPTTMLQIHNKFAQFCEPYVPYLHGDLRDSGAANIYPDKVVYDTPYAHYQYVLHDMNADLNKETNRTRVTHPLATSYWDKAMMSQKGDEFTQAVKDILVARAKELYG